MSSFTPIARLVEMLQRGYGGKCLDLNWPHISEPASYLQVSTERFREVIAEARRTGAVIGDPVHPGDGNRIYVRGHWKEEQVRNLPLTPGAGDW